MAPVVEAFLKYLALNRRMSAHTVSAYGSDLEQYSAFCGGAGTDITAGLQARLVRQWMAELMGKGMTARSVHRKLSTLRSFSRYLRRQGLLQNDPLARISAPKMPGRIVQDIPAADLQAMFNRYPWHETDHGPRDKVLLLLFYTTGMRLSELIGLDCADIDTGRCVLRVTGKRNKQRMIPLHPEMAELLQEYTGGRKGPLFTTRDGKPLYRLMVYRLVNHYLRNFSDALKTSPHVLRHSFATHMLNNGAQLLAIKEILGHASLAATQVYTKNSFEKLKKIHALHPRG